MKKFLLSLLLCFGAVQISTAQLDAELVAQFLNAVVEKDVPTLLDVLHPDYSQEVDKLIAQCDFLKFQNWNFVHAKNITTYEGRSATEYLVAMKVGLQPIEITDDVLDYSTRQLILTPSGHIFLYEVLYVATDNGRKYVFCNADVLSIIRAEQLMRENGKQLHSKYYNGDY